MGKTGGYKQHGIGLRGYECFVLTQSWSCQVQSDLLADPHMLLPYQLMSLKNVLIESKTEVLDSLQNGKDDAHGMCSSP